jgi:hypothetical protein
MLFEPTVIHNDETGEERLKVWIHAEFVSNVLKYIGEYMQGAHDINLPDGDWLTWVSIQLELVGGFINPFALLPDGEERSAVLAQPNPLSTMNQWRDCYWLNVQAYHIESEYTEITQQTMAEYVFNGFNE